MAEGDQTSAAASVDGGAGPAGGAPAPAPAPAPTTPAPAPAPAPIPPPPAPESDDAPLSPLEIVTTERDDYRRRLETVEAELRALTEASPDADTINKLQQDNDHLRKTLKKATDMLREKMTSCNVQEKKNQALTQQVTTLKEVLQVTRDLLNIRNLEVEQLQKNVDSMEARIDDNRRRQSAMIKQMEQATKINGELRNEYETQLRIFQSLKERYEEKVTALTNLANVRQKHNSEGIEKFEDAQGTEAAHAGSPPETKPAVQVVDTTGTSDASDKTNDSETFASQPANSSEASAPEANSSEITAPNTIESTVSTVASASIDSAVATTPETTSETDAPQSKTSEIVAPETTISTVSQPTLLETNSSTEGAQGSSDSIATMPQISTSETVTPQSNSPEAIAQEAIAQETSAPI